VNPGAEYMTISEFARMCGASAKTLRFYGDIGLFRPAAIEPRSRYRFYLPDQLRDFARIQSMRDCGASLSEISRALRRRTIPNEERRLLAKLRQARLDAIEVAQRSLIWLEAALKEVESPTSLRVTVTHCKPVKILSVRTELKRYDDIHKYEHALLNAVPTRSVGSLRGVLWHRCADSGIMEGEAFVELKGANLNASAFQTAELPAGPVARAFSSLDDDEAESTYVGLSRWIRSQGYDLAGARREIYRGNLLEIQYPLGSAL
jgi:DNA-binding transcriptional MerR regulator